MKVPLTRPLTGLKEQELVAEVITSGWLTQGPRVADFEQAVAEYLEVKHAIACSNCTTALHLALILYHIGPSDEVIVPSYTWIATANVVRMVGAKPVFADIDLATFNITPETIAAVITPQTKAIILVDQFGLPADLDGIREVARRHDLAVIEDAACAIGSRYKGRLVGGHGHVTCFSFHPRKVITTGEGGMLVTDDQGLAAQARRLLNHGASVSDLAKHKAGTVEALLAEEFSEMGYNYRMTNLQGALGLVQMARLEEILAGRRQRAERYTAALAGIPYLIPPTIPAYVTPNWQSYALRISSDCPLSRNAVAQRLLDAGIACRPAYMACHVQPVYRQLYPHLTLPYTEQALETVIILPLYPQMNDEEQDYVIGHLQQAVK